MKCRNSDLVAFVFRSVLIGVVLIGVFGLVYLRSSIVRIEYSLGELERKKAECMRDRKLLLAEKTSLLSFARFESPEHDENGFVVPDRVKVVHIGKNTSSLPRQAALKQQHLVTR